jgi:hypothetical protein
MTKVIKDQNEKIKITLTLNGALAVKFQNELNNTGFTGAGLVRKCIVDELSKKK